MFDVEGFKLHANGISCDPVAGIVSLFRKDGVDAPRPINFTNGLHDGKRFCNKKDKPTMDEVCICMMGKCFWEAIHEDVKAAIVRTGNGEEFGAAHAEPSVHKTSLHVSFQRKLCRQRTNLFASKVNYSLLESSTNELGKTFVPSGARSRSSRLETCGT